MLTVNQYSPLSCFCILSLAARTATTISSVHRTETSPPRALSHLPGSPLTHSYTSMDLHSLHAATQRGTKLLSTQSFLGNGAQRQRRDSEREKRKRQRREMEAVGGAGGNSMPARGNGGNNLRWRCINFPERPTCHVNIESFPMLLL